MVHSPDCPDEQNTVWKGPEDAVQEVTIIQNMLHGSRILKSFANAILGGWGMGYGGRDQEQSRMDKDRGREAHRNRGTCLGGMGE